jgi:putative restriction endonuclease
MASNLWTREELILAFNLYLKLPFGKMHSRTPEIVDLANLMDRTANSIAIRLSNFAACDPFHQRRGVKGLIGGIKQCQPIWNEFFQNQEALVFESEKILANKENQTLENKYNKLLFDIENLKGEDKLREVKTRVNQDVFRQIILANYSGKCALTGIDLPDLLVASHIIPWKDNKGERLNPENGICFSALYDKAFDKGLIGVNENYHILLSKKLKKRSNQDFYVQYFAPFDDKMISIPDRYKPKKEFLEYHLDVIFEK